MWVSLVSIAVPVAAAERIYFNYGLFGFSLPVADLEAYSKTGVVSERLAYVLNLARVQPSLALRDALTQQAPLNSPAALSELTYGPLGTKVLQGLGDQLRTDKDNNSFHALRAAMLLAAADPQGLTFLNFLRYYPLDTFFLDLQQNLALANTVVTGIEQGREIYASIERQAQSETPTDAPVPAEDLQAAGPRSWQMQTLRFANPRRGTLALFDDPIWTTIGADIYLPQGLTQPAPLVVISHGLGSNRRTFAYLARHLASWGIAVAAVEHPDSDTEAVARAFKGRSTVRGRSTFPFVARPLYVSMLLDRLQQLSSDPAWQGRLDMARIGAFGQSWGGYTVLALAGANIDYEFVRRICNIELQITVLINPSVLLECTLDSAPLEPMDLRDPRIKAVFAVNPLAAAVAGPRGIGQIQIPTMILSASEDLFARPVGEQILPFNWLTTQDKYLVLAKNATHFTPTLGDDGGDSAFQLPAWMIGPPPAQMFRALDALSVAFFKKYLEGADRYDGYLGQGYARSLGEEPMRFSFVSSLNDGTKQSLAAIFKKYTGIEK